MRKVVVTKDRLFDMADDVIATVVAKNTDYGDAWQAHGRLGALIRLYDKCMRYMNVTKNMTMFVTDERIEDTIRDMIGYGLLLLLHFEEIEYEDQSETEEEKETVATVLRRLSCQEGRIRIQQPNRTP